MEHKQEIEEAPKDYHVTKIGGQLTAKDVTKPESKLSAIASKVPTTNGGRLHVHIGMIFKEAE